jgi:hypothetical protein
VLAQALNVAARDLLGDGHMQIGESDSTDPIVRQIAALDYRERTQLWRALAGVQKKQKSRALSIEARQLAQQIDELLAHIEFIRDELENVRRRLRRTT